MKRTIAILSVFAVFGIILTSGNAWAHEGRGAGRCGVEKRYVDYYRPYVQKHYRREYVNQNNGNHYGWVQNQPGRLGNLSEAQQTKVKEFWEKQKS